MHTLGAYFVLSLASFSLALPADVPAECAPPTKERRTEVSKCCKSLATGFQEKIQDAMDSCLDLVKDKGAKGEEKKDGLRSVPKPEGFECMGDCIYSKLGYMTDKRLDAKKIMPEVKLIYTGDWATVGPAFVQKCLDQLASADKNECPTSGADNFTRCILRQSFLSCPTKSWTDSEVCNANKERLEKCPKALPLTA